MRQVLTLILSTIILLIGAMFSLVVLAIAAALGIIAFSYFWWKTRAVRKMMREQASAAPGDAAATVDGTIIEGEAVVIREPRDQIPINHDH